MSNMRVKHVCVEHACKHVYVEHACEACICRTCVTSMYMSNMRVKHGMYVSNMHVSMYMPSMHVSMYMPSMHVKHVYDDHACEACMCRKCV